MLVRQLRKLGLEAQKPPDAETWSKLLTVIDQTYHDADQDRYTLERSFTISSEEMHALYQRQKSSYEARLRALFGTIQDLVWLKDPDGVYLACNPMFERFFGATEAEIVGKTDYDFVDKELADYFRKHDRFAIDQGGPSYNEECVTFADDGHVAWMETVKTPMHDESGLLIGVIGVARDITERKKILEKLSLRESYLTAIIENQDGMVWLKDKGGRYLAVNRKYLEVCGKSIRQIIGKTDRDLWPQEIAEKYQADDARVLMTGKSILIEESGLDNGVVCWYETFKSPVINEQGEVVATTGASHDITERKQVEDDLRISAITFETHEAIMITDEHARIIRVNQAFTDITGYSAEEVLGGNPRIMSSGRQDKAFYVEMWQQLLHTGSWSGEIWDKRKNGQIYPKWLNITAVKNEQSETTRYVAIFSDITARKQTEEEIRNLAFYDALTKLPNRRLFLERFRAALPISARNNIYGAVLFIDMDRFKILNDTLGHDYGDLMLIEVAVRIRSCVREMDTVARLGGDEFVVLIGEISTDAEEASRKVGQVAEKIRGSLARPYNLNGHEHHSSPSIGISLFRGNEETIDVLIQQADMAMYQAKNSGRNAVRFFDPVMQLNVAEHAAIRHDLYHAIVRQELHLHYQIQIDDNHRPLGAEALLRWIHPVRGLLMPDQFIPIAEEGTLILDVDKWVLESACQQLALWGKNIQTQNLRLSINISAKKFAQPHFVDKIADMLSRHRFNPGCLKLGLTESMALNDFAGMVKKMHALKVLGIRLVMDDFGSGYSSLSLLKQLPLDQLKIGREFVLGITRDGNDALLVEAIVNLANSFRLSVIAEGVETDAQLTFLKHCECMAYQGALFGMPVPLSDFEALLKNSPFKAVVKCSLNLPG